MTLPYRPNLYVWIWKYDIKNNNVMYFTVLFSLIKPLSLWPYGECIGKICWNVTHRAWCVIFTSLCTAKQKYELNEFYYTELKCTVQYCRVLYCTVLYLLYCTVLYCTLLYSNLMYCTVLQWNVLHCNLL